MIEDFIQKAEKKAEKLERDLYDEVMAIIIGLIAEQGRVVWNVSNLSLIGTVDKAFEVFNQKYQTPYMNSIKKELAGLNKYYVDYFKSIGVDTKSLRGFKTLLSRMDKYLDELSALTPVKQELKQYLLGAISGGRTLGSIRKGVMSILGKKERTGALKRFYDQFLFDAVMQFDRIVNNRLAEQNNLTFFVYAGGLIDTSREFCQKRNGLVFRKDMVDDWKDDPTLPGYPNVADYEPLVELGRWNCRHSVDWITDEQAKERLKNED